MEQVYGQVFIQLMGDSNMKETLKFSTRSERERMLSWLIIKMKDVQPLQVIILTMALQIFIAFTLKNVNLNRIK